MTIEVVEECLPFIAKYLRHSAIFKEAAPVKGMRGINYAGSQVRSSASQNKLDIK